MKTKHLERFKTCALVFAVLAGLIVSLASSAFITANPHTNAKQPDKINQLEISPNADSEKMIVLPANVKQQDTTDLSRVVRVAVQSVEYVEPLNYSSVAGYVINMTGTNYSMFNLTAQKLEWNSSSASEIFNACIGNLTNGGKITIRNGIYIINSRINIINDNISIVGEGASQLKLANFTTSDVIYAYGRTGLTIQNIIVDGNKENNINSGNKGIQHGINLINCTNSKIDHVQVRNCIHTGINLYGGNNNVITNNIALNNGGRTYDSGSGIDCDGSNNTVIMNNVAEGNYVNGLWVTGTAGTVTNVTVSGNILRNNGGSPTEGHGLHIGTAQGLVTYSDISNNIVSGNLGYAGILVTSTYNTKIENNTSENNKGRGFSFLNSQYLTISLNIARNNADYGGFILSTNCSHNVISNNIAVNNSNYDVGILWPSAIGNTIANNFFNSNSIIYDKGTNTIIENNTFNFGAT